MKSLLEYFKISNIKKASNQPWSKWKPAPILAVAGNIDDVKNLLKSEDFMYIKKETKTNNIILWIIALKGSYSDKHNKFPALLIKSNADGYITVDRGMRGIFSVKSAIYNPTLKYYEGISEELIDSDNIPLRVD